MSKGIRIELLSETHSVVIFIGIPSKQQKEKSNNLKKG